ncbi:Inversin [Folsomia candida]|uniref:Inversin n=1 Tax=Folsomia candida TaxID=158441 RepID=A0A226EJI0_FOLCA|nr:Inversin [Folsomia candida]
MRSSVVGHHHHGGTHHHNSSDRQQELHPQHRNYNNNNNMTKSRQNGPTTGSGHHIQPHRSSSTNGLADSFNKHNKAYDSRYDELESQQSNQNNLEARRELREKRERDFVPSFVLLDACISNNERKVREICRKLSTLDDDDVEPVINFQDQAGRTPLSYACCGGSIPVIEELSRIRNIDVNLGDNDGNVPLHYAAQAGQSEAVDLLIARFGTKLDLDCRNSTGACANLKDYSRGLTAAEWARLCGRYICAEVITRSAKDAHRHSGSSLMNFSTMSKALPGSRSNMELKRISSDESPYYHLYARSTISGATWLKNKIRKALGAGSSQTCNSPMMRRAPARPPISDGSYTLMGGATICAGSVLLPSIKPLIEQQRARQSVAHKKFTIPTLQVTPVKR